MMVTRPMVITARYDGDRILCGRCGRVIGEGLAPTTNNACLPCKACGEWVRLGLRELRG